MRLAQGDCVGKFKVKGMVEFFGKTKEWLRDLKGQGDEAIQECWIKN